MKSAILTVVVIGLVALVPQQAAAYGALAIGLPDDIAEGGVAMGTAYNYPTKAGAEARALQECRSFQDAPESTRNLCRVYETFQDQCVAISMDPKAGTPGLGWDISPEKSTAKKNAIVRCEQTAGDRREYCIMSLEKSAPLSCALD
jgi:hypothetical protein